MRGSGTNTLLSGGQARGRVRPGRVYEQALDWPPVLRDLSPESCLELLKMGPSRPEASFTGGFTDYKALWRSFPTRQPDQWGEEGMNWHGVVAVGQIAELRGQDRDRPLAFCSLQVVARKLEIVAVLQRRDHEDLASAVEAAARRETKAVYGSSPTANQRSLERCRVAWGIAAGLGIARSNCAGWEKLENFNAALKLR